MKKLNYYSTEGSLSSKEWNNITYVHYISGVVLGLLGVLLNGVYVMIILLVAILIIVWTMINFYHKKVFLINEGNYKYVGIIIWSLNIVISLYYLFLNM